MNRDVVAYALALVIALGWAYRTWTAPAEPDLGDKIVVLPGTIEELEVVTYRSDKIDVTLTAKQDALGRYLWARVEPLGEAPPPPDPDNPHAPPPDSHEIEEFKAGKEADTVTKGLAPFVASRTLDSIGDDKLADLGLDEPAAMLTIQRSGKEPKTYEVGTDVYGGANVYVRDPDGGKIYVVDAKVLKPFKAGKRALPDRSLLDMENKAIAKISVRAGQASAEFEQHNPDDPQAAFWSTAGGDQANASGAAWIDKVLRLRSSRYLPQGSEPGGLEEVYAFTAHATDGHTVTVTVWRGMDDEGEEQWFAQSEHTRAVVELQKALAAETAADLASALDTAQ